MTYLLLIVTAGLVSYFALKALAFWAGRLPEARAWDPQTHDKMTCYSLELLQQTPQKTLLGWVLEKGRASGTEGEIIKMLQLELRRGSIEEDMNSHMVNAIRSVSRSADFLLALPIVGWKISLVMYLSKRIAVRALENMESLEGANGAYHFYNPFSENSVKGLSEPLWVALLVKNIPGSGCNRPMPSAMDRAFETGRTWTLDNEGRNYSLQEASRYYWLGHQHLSFYAMGRIIHLLQDMAVPAHVRDDSHLGIPMVEPSDPLEKHAAEEDWEWGEAGDAEKWSFKPERAFTRHRGFIHQAKSLWNSERQHARGAMREVFSELAAWTYLAFYSYGTIPGNADSHDPNNTDREPFRRTGPVDWRKCAPNVEILWTLLARFERCGHRIYEKWPWSIAPKANFNPQDSLELLRLVLEKKTKNSGDIQTFLEHVGALDSDISFIGPDRIRDSGAMDLLSPRTPEHLLHLEEREWFVNYRFWKDWLKPVYDRLSGTLLPAARNMPGASAQEVMKAWIDSCDPDSLVEIFRGRQEKDKSSYFSLDPFYPHGPCCLSPDIIQRQYQTVFPKAVLYGAFLMANWFEYLFRPGQGLGLGVWSNRNAADANSVPRVEVLQEIKDSQEVEAQLERDQVAFTLGLNHHLPVDLDMTLEVTLEIGEERAVDEVLQIIPTLTEVRGDNAGNAKTLDRMEVGRNRTKASNVVGEAAPYNRDLFKSFKLPFTGGPRGGIRREQEESAYSSLQVEQVPWKGGTQYNNSYLLRLDFSLAD